MKRGAERQLTKDDNAEDEEEYEFEPGQGLKKADEKVLAARPMKGLPRRAGMSGPTPSLPLTPSASVTPEPPAPTPKFAGFTGFGVPSSAPTPFVFSAAKPTGPPSSTSNPFQMGKPSLSSGIAAPTAFQSSTPAPAVSATASPATKTFASFLNPTPSAPVEPKPQAQNVSDSEDAQLKAETTYYAALRGLNVSFMATVSKAIDSDPFADVSGMFERYKSLREAAQKELDESIKKASSAPTPATPTPAAAPAPAPVASASFSFGKTSAPGETNSKPAFSMPAAPSSFKGFGNLTASSSTGSSPSPAGGFKPSAFPIPATLTFGPGASSASDSASSPAPAASKPVFPGAPSPFGASSGAGGFKFGGDSGKKATGMVFGSTNAPSVFASNLFGGDASDDKDKEKEKDKDKDRSTVKAEKDEKDEKKDTVPVTSASSFFSSAPIAFSTPEKPSSSSAPGASPTSPSPFTFGAASPGKPTGLFGGFGTKPAAVGSFGNPVGFGFGSPPKAGEEDAAPAASTAKPFSFAPFGSGASTSALGSTDASASASEAGTPAPEDAPAAPMLESRGSVHDLDGEGEEDEETAHEIRSKVYRFVKNEEGESSWKDLGIGMLKVKVKKDKSARRLLLRNSQTGRVTVNFNVYDGMDPLVKKNTVSLVGHDDGAPTSYMFRVKTNDLADDLKKALDRQIEFVKAKASE